MKWLKALRRARTRRQSRRAAAEEGKYSFELVLWDGAGERFGGIGEVEPEMLERILGELAQEVFRFAEGDGDLERESRERTGFTQVER